MIYILLIILLILIISVVAFSWMIARISQTPKREKITTTPNHPYININIPSNGGTLKGWLINQSTISPLIILVHGWGSSRNTMIRYIDRLYQEGYSLLLFDIRSHGESDGVKALTVKTFKDDVIEVIKFANSQLNMEKGNIGILGHSFGGFGSLLALKEDLPVKVIITDSSPVSFKTIMQAYFNKYKLPKFLIPIVTRICFLRARIKIKEVKNDLDVLKVLKNNLNKPPILMAHSKNDGFVPYHEMEKVTKKFPEIKKLYLNCKGHRKSETDPAFWREIIPFLNQHLKH